MPKLRENNINDFAFDYLRSYYVGRHSPQAILVSKAESTKKGASASGLFALRTADHAIFVAALHTKHSSDIAGILTRYKKRGLSNLRYLTPMVFFAGMLYVHKLMHLSNILYVLPVLTALTGFILHSLLEKAYLKRRLTQMADALKQTPATEQWLGISISSPVLRHNALASHLISVCRQRGIGILTVGKRAKVVLLQAPRTTACRRSDFLSYYQAGSQIRQALHNDALLRVA